LCSLLDTAAVQHQYSIKGGSRERKKSPR